MPRRHPSTPTMSGRRRPMVRHASPMFRNRLTRLRVVGWYAQIARSPDRSDVPSGLSNVTQTRSNRSHHSLRLYSCVRCPPESRRAARKDGLGGRGHESRRDPASGVVAGRGAPRLGTLPARGRDRSGFGTPLPLEGVPAANAIEARQRRHVVIVGRPHPLHTIPVPVAVGPAPFRKRSCSARHPAPDADLTQLVQRVRDRTALVARRSR